MRWWPPGYAAMRRYVTAALAPIVRDDETVNVPSDGVDTIARAPGRRKGRRLTPRPKIPPADGPARRALGLTIVRGRPADANRADRPRTRRRTHPRAQPLDERREARGGVQWMQQRGDPQAAGAHDSR